MRSWPSIADPVKSSSTPYPMSDLCISRSPPSIDSCFFELVAWQGQLRCQPPNSAISRAVTLDAGLASRSWPARILFAIWSLCHLHQSSSSPSSSSSSCSRLPSCGTRSSLDSTSSSFWTGWSCSPPVPGQRTRISSPTGFSAVDEFPPHQ
jgi:hypothetical protein